MSSITSVIMANSIEISYICNTIRMQPASAVTPAGRKAHTADSNISTKTLDAAELYPVIPLISIKDINAAANFNMWLITISYLPYRRCSPSLIFNNSVITFPPRYLPLFFPRG